MSFYGDLKKYKNNIAAISDDGAVCTYGDISDFADRFCNTVNHRCLVFCLCDNSLGSICGYVSMLRGRIVPLLLEKDLNADLLLGLISNYKPEYLWIPNDKVKNIFNTITENKLEIVFSECNYTLVKTNFVTSYHLCSDLALLLTTSGSTGSPKLVRQSYKNIDSNAAAIIQCLEIDESERPISTLPMNYTYCLSIIHSHLATGSTLLITNKTLMEEDFWKFFKEQKATSFGGVPYTYEILKKLRFFMMDLPSLQVMTQAGGKLTVELTREFVEFSLLTKRRFIVMYGQTEATARMSYLPFEYALAKCGSMGIAIPGGEFSLIDEKGNIIDSSETIGELVYKGPNVTLGYAECGEDLIRGDDMGGVLVTGDMAKRDADGFYYITGRKKRFVKLYGNRVNLDESERLIKNIVSDCACTGKDDRMIIYITEVSMIDNVKRFISEKTGINHFAFDVRFINDIPKNESGKTVYSRL